MTDTTPAFPIVTSTAIVPGMDLRDYFAAHAIAAVIKKSELAYKHNQFHYLAKDAYLIADEMMEARKENK